MRTYSKGYGSQGEILPGEVAKPLIGDSLTPGEKAKVRRLPHKRARQGIRKFIEEEIEIAEDCDA